MSPVSKLRERARALESRASWSAQPLFWLVEAGRISGDVTICLAAMSAVRFAKVAEEIAATMGSIRSCADAWIVAGTATKKVGS